MKQVNISSKFRGNTMENKTQQEFLAFIEAEKAKGLVDIRFVCGDVSQATITSFMAESLAIDRAIADGRHSPIED